MMTPQKEPLLDFLDLCACGISRVNLLLVRMAHYNDSGSTGSRVVGPRIEGLAGVCGEMYCTGCPSVPGALAFRVP